MEIKYNDRAEAVRDIRRSGAIIFGHREALTRLCGGDAKSADSPEKLEELLNEIKEVSAICEAVNDYTVNHPDDGRIMKDLEHLKENLSALKKFDRTAEMKEFSPIMGYWTLLHHAESEVQDAWLNLWNESKNDQSAKVVQPQRKKKVKTTFRDLIQFDNPDKLLKTLHKLIDDKKPIEVAAVIEKAYRMKLIYDYPNREALFDEFPNCANSYQAVHNYFRNYDLNKHFTRLVDNLILLP